MNDEAIFFKTLAGDEAVRERTRLVQRNLRMVLILVDGFADVAELKRKVGDGPTVESALAELERLGLVESIDARMARNSAAVAAAGTAAADQMEPEAVPEAGVEEESAAEEEVPLLSEVVALSPAGDEAEIEEPEDEPELPVRAEEAEEPEETDEGPLTDGLTVFDGETAAKAWMVPGLGSGGEAAAPAAPEPAKPGRGAGPGGWWQRFRARRAQAKEEALYEKAYGRSEPASSAGHEEEPLAEPAAEAARTVLPKVRRGPRVSIGLGRGLVLGVLGLVLVLLLVIVFFPYGTYRGEFERYLSQALGEPVRVHDVQVSFTPYPAITLEGVAVGDDGYATVEALRLLPEPVSLLGIHRYREIRVEGLQVKEGGLPRLSRWLAPGALGDVTVARLTLSNMSLDLARRPVSGLNGSVELDERQGMARVVFGQAEDHLQVVAVPRPEGVVLSLKATDWNMPVGPALNFARLEVAALLVPGGLRVDRIEGRLYEGGIGGSGEVVWTGEPKLSLALELARVQADRILDVFGAQPGLEGLVSSKLRVAATAASLGGLADALRIEGSFEVSQGHLKRIDLAEVLRSAGQGTPVTGGTTRFEEFSGVFAADEAVVRLSRLRLTSGLLHAYGQVSVSRQSGTISGGGTAEMRGSATTVRTGLSLTGKAADPTLKPGQ